MPHKFTTLYFALQEFLSYDKGFYDICPDLNLRIV